MSPEEKQQIIDELRLVPKNYWWTLMLTKIVTLQHIKNGIPKNSKLVRQYIKSAIKI